MLTIVAPPFHGMSPIPIDPLIGALVAQGGVWVGCCAGIAFAGDVAFDLSFRESLSAWDL
jgi:hypothetical protein